ncbi:hypothetical protein PHET_01587 [Paragonimus heterotremus]|uniref:Ig-like domain-containing protein n=1 Tax=Paragonimus heterotremus TaxID=100268 RepID=A0A8J4SQZ4_9TREM|nr:hypothetical protein PHET_01587 [Paragonimus heterotremus]
MNLAILSFFALNYVKPPVIVEHSPKLAVAQIGGNVTLFCRWSANPRANVSWHRGRLSNIDAIMTNEKMNINLVKANLSRWIQKKGPVPRSSQLLLTNFQISDTDMYSCRVTNSLGTATQTVAVIRKGKSVQKFYLSMVAHFFYPLFTFLSMYTLVHANASVIQKAMLCTGHSTSKLVQHVKVGAIFDKSSGIFCNSGSITLSRRVFTKILL